MSARFGHYDTLGVGKDAAPEEVKRAFRKRARATHPDAGGKTEEFQAVNAAYQVLSDPGRRRRYDETGDDGAHVDEAAQILNAVGNLVFQIIEAVDVSKNDVIDLARREIKKAISDSEVHRVQVQKAIAKRERAAKRLTRRSGQNMLGMMVEHEIGKMKGNITAIDDLIAMRRKMLVLLDDYEYAVDKEAAPEPTQYVTFTIR